MKSKENIVFLGMMGSGKSTIGTLFSKKLNFNFCDIDKLIEQESNMKISEIFKKNGEKYFRLLEEKITLKILKKNRTVIALGGGAFLNKKIRDEILMNHLSIWLNLDNKTLIDRIFNSSKRPVVVGLTKEKLNDLIEKRSKIYTKALYKINCTNLTKKNVLDKIMDVYEAH